MFKLTLSAALLAVLTVGSWALADQSDTDLDQKLNSEYSGAVTQNPGDFDMTQALVQLRAFNKDSKGHMVRCNDAQKTMMGTKYLATVDENGKECHIYDLSFPNLKALFANHNHGTQIPVQRMKAGDYINWLDGDFQAVDDSIATYQKNFDPRAAGNQSWVSKLKFKNTVAFVPGSKVSALDAGLPQSFKLSDLDMGTDFQFDAQSRQEIQNLLKEMNGQDPIANDFLLSILVNPNSLLDSVTFDWNDVKKVYDVIMTGEFLPIKPVALIEYQAQYKYAVEKAFRGLLAKGLMKLTTMIPNPTIAAAVGVLVTDAFEQLDMAYEYQMLQLEDTLRATDPSISDRALNVLYGERTDLIQAYLLALAQHKPFDWEALEKQGYAARYADEKTRNVTTAKMNSKLVLDKGCQMSLMHDYFGTCTKSDSSQEIYSLMSERIVFSHSFGAPLIYALKTPSQTTMRRGVAWILSIGLRIFGLPLGANNVTKLNTIIKNYMYTGILDEALLRDNLASKGDTSDLTKWLYIQNLNVFLPKSATIESHVIDANKKLLGVQ